MATTTQQISAQDGMPHAPSADPSVHRVLVVVDPPMQGPRRRGTSARSPHPPEGARLRERDVVPTTAS